MAVNGFFERRPTLLLLVGAIVLPNLVFFVLEVAGVSIQPRTAAILGYGIVALSARLTWRAATVVLYLLVLAYDVLTTIAGSFNLTLAEMLYAVRFGANLDVSSSQFYVVLTIVISLGAALMIWLLVTKRDVLARGGMVPVIVVLALVALIDFTLKVDVNDRFSRIAAAGQPFESATRTSGFEAAILKGGDRDALVIIVEALGVFAAPDHQAILTHPFNDPDLNAAYEVTQRQQNRIARAAEAFLASHPERANMHVRFDLIVVAGLAWPDHIRAAWGHD